MPGVGDDRFKTSNQLVFALSAGIETLHPMGDRVIHALVKAGLEVQPVELSQAPPVAPIETVAADQAERHRHRP